MKASCKIYIKAKNPVWYQAAQEYENVKQWEEWDEGKTPRYVREVGFRFPFDVLSIETFKEGIYTLNVLDPENNNVTLPLANVRIVKFKGPDTEAEVVISEAILDQTFKEEKKGKTYIYFYIKEKTKFGMLSNNIWLSEEHMSLTCERLKNGFYLHAPEVELLTSASQFGSSM